VARRLAPQFADSATRLVFFSLLAGALLCSRAAAATVPAEDPSRAEPRDAPPVRVSAAASLEDAEQSALLQPGSRYELLGNALVLIAPRATRWLGRLLPIVRYLPNY
jgi:hypothetical protein